jgi:NADPH:quinone reductase-like Zn-dependent oxidoreductase
MKKIMIGKKIVIHRPGSWKELKVESFTPKEPGPDEVLIECRACGINFADVCVRMGIYSSAKKYVGWPITPGFEASGVVLKCGSNVTQFAVGTKVCALTRFGGYSTHLTLNQDQLFPLPDGFSFEQGASFPSVFLTAWYALCELAHPHPGDALLIHSAAGGVGGALIQIAKALGCQVVAVVGKPHKVVLPYSLGADHVIDKSTQNLWKQAKHLFPEDYQVILDANGQQTLKESYKHLAKGGKLVVYGFHTMLTKGRGTPNWFKLIRDYLRTPRFNPLEMTSSNKSVLAFNLSYLFSNQARFNQAQKELLKWVLEGKISPLPVTVFPFEQVAEAHKALESGETVGKLVLGVTG